MHRLLSPEFINEVKDRNDITDVISGYVSLKRSGRNSKGLCPFHSEKTPSFTVYGDTSSFYCFGCQAGGDVITFISRIENLPLLTCLFETGSAIGTVGLTLGITSSLSAVSRVILMILMFFGRVGGLTLIYAALPSADGQNSRLPLEKISVG